MAMGDLKARLRARFARRYSTTSSLSSAEGDADARARRSPRSLRSKTSRGPGTSASLSLQVAEGQSEVGDAVVEANVSDVCGIGNAGTDDWANLNLGGCDLQKSPAIHHVEVNVDENHHHNDPTSCADFPTPNTDSPPDPDAHEGDHEAGDLGAGHSRIDSATPQLDYPPSEAPSQRPVGPSRQQSLLPYQQTRLINTLLETELPAQSRATAEYFANHRSGTISANMMSRKIWVKRPGSSATLVTIHEDDLVDDVREMILKKYANSLGRTFDAPDVTLRIVPRDAQERTLGPEEPMARTLDHFFPGGQTVSEALIIDVPFRRTPKPSPRPHGVYYEEERRPTEAGNDYFPPMPPSIPSPHIPTSLPAHVNGQHSMSVLTTGHVPNLPSPGTARRHHQRERPRIGRQHTSSPTAMGGQAQSQPGGTYPIPYDIARRSPMSDKSIPSAGPPPTAPPLPTPPAQSQVEMASQIQRVATPPPRVSSPRPSNKPRKTKKTMSNGDHPSLPAGMLNVAVPPINVLIVEDNIINLKLLEAFMKRLKVRWQTAMNGREAVTKWRAGGFHLVLMDIQLPIMNGLEATKEIRRLERLNSIGVFSSSASSSAPSIEEEGEEVDGEDKLPSSVLFKSPVIIVALTASNLQSDRHEALAAGCNDFLTKPVNFVWLERKVMEWGCMQALIDFDGWRKWKDFSSLTSSKDSEDKGEKKLASKKKKGSRMSVGSGSGSSTVRPPVREEIVAA